MTCASDGGSHDPVMDYSGHDTQFVLAALDLEIDGVPHRHAICKHCKCLVWITEDEVREAKRRASSASAPSPDRG